LEQIDYYIIKNHYCYQGQKATLLSRYLTWKNYILLVRGSKAL